MSFVLEFSTGILDSYLLSNSPRSGILRVSHVKSVFHLLKHSIWFCVVVTPLPRASTQNVDGESVTDISEQTQIRQSSRASKKQWEESTLERRALGMKKAAITVCYL